MHWRVHVRMRDEIYMMHFSDARRQFNFNFALYSLDHPIQLCSSFFLSLFVGQTRVCQFNWRLVLNKSVRMCGHNCGI